MPRDTVLSYCTHLLSAMSTKYVLLAVTQSWYCWCGGGCWHGFATCRVLSALFCYCMLLTTMCVVCSCCSLLRVVYGRVCVLMLLVLHARCCVLLLTLM